MESTGCKNYGNNESFLSCEENEVKNSIKAALGCLPLSISMDTENYCKQNENFSVQSIDEFSKIVDRLDSYLPTEKCPSSCTKHLYDSYLIKSEGVTGRVIQLIFQEDILITKAEPQYTFLPILTTIGGHIGVCRTLLWALLGIGGLKTVYLTLRKCCQNRVQNDN